MSTNPLEQEFEEFYATLNPLAVRKSVARACFFAGRNAKLLALTRRARAADALAEAAKEIDIGECSMTPLNSSRKGWCSTHSSYASNPDNSGDVCDEGFAVRRLREALAEYAKGKEE